MTVFINFVYLDEYNLHFCTVELQDLTVCVAVNGENTTGFAVTLNLIEQCSIYNLSKLLSYATNIFNFIFLDRQLFSHHATRTHAHTVLKDVS